MTKFYNVLDNTYVGFQLYYKVYGKYRRIININRDISQFENPDQLNVTRQENKHLAFGHGIHYCLGAPLARLEGIIALNTMFKQFPNMQLQIPPDQLKWRSGVLFRGLENFPVIF